MSRITTAPWANSLRGFAMILIVFGHAIGYCDALDDLSEYLSSFYVPLFFLVSGYLFQNNPQESNLAYIKRKALRILVPYYVFALLSLLPFYLFSGEVQEYLGSNRDIDNGVLHALVNILYASGHNGGLAQNSPLWFLPCYFTVVVLAKLVYGKISAKNKYTSTFLALGFFCAGYIVYKFFNYPLPYCLETALIMLFFYFLGNQVRILQLGKKKMAPLVASSFLGLGFYFHLFNDKISCMNNDYDDSFLFFILAATCSTIGFLFLFQCLKPSRMLSYLGHRTIPILVTHKMPIVFFQAKDPLISHYLHESIVGIQLLLAVYITVMAIGLCLLVYKVVVRFLPWIYGER